MTNENMSKLISQINNENYTAYIGEDLKYDSLRQMDFMRIKQNSTGLNTIINAVSLNFYASTGALFGYIKKLEKQFDKYNIDVSIDFDVIENHISVEFINKFCNVYDEDVSLSFGDLILIPTFDVNDTRVVITKKHLMQWNKSFDEILKVAYANLKDDIHNEIFPDNGVAVTKFKNHRHGAIAPVLNFEYFNFLKSQGLDSVFVFTNIYNGLVAPVYPDTVKTSKDKLVQSWYSYINEVLTNNNTDLSYNVNFYNCENDEIIFGSDIYKIEYLKKLFGAE